MTTEDQAREKLIRARVDIEKILRQYDIGGVVVLHAAPNRAEYIMHLEPSYSCIKVLNDGAVRIRSKLVDYNGDKAAQTKGMEDTANMASSLFELSAKLSLQLGALSEVIDKATGAEHTGLEHQKPN